MVSSDIVLELVACIAPEGTILDFIPKEALMERLFRIAISSSRKNTNKRPAFQCMENRSLYKTLEYKTLYKIET